MALPTPSVKKVCVYVCYGDLQRDIYFKNIASGTGGGKLKFVGASGARGVGRMGERSRARCLASECSALQPHANKTLVSNLLPCGREQRASPAPIVRYAPYYMTCYSDGLWNFTRILITEQRFMNGLEPDTTRTVEQNVLRWDDGPRSALIVFLSRRHFACFIFCLFLIGRTHCK